VKFKTCAAVFVRQTVFPFFSAVAMTDGDDDDDDDDNDCDKERAQSVLDDILNIFREKTYSDERHVFPYLQILRIKVLYLVIYM